MNYNLELDKAIKTINKDNYKQVLIQLPDGLKPKAELIKKELEKKTKAKIIIWLPGCFGACDIPNVEKLGIDLIIQFGHTVFKR